MPVSGREPGPQLARGVAVSAGSGGCGAPAAWPGSCTSPGWPARAPSAAPSHSDRPATMPITRSLASLTRGTITPRGNRERRIYPWPSWRGRLPIAPASPPWRRSSWRSCSAPASWPRACSTARTAAPSAPAPAIPARAACPWAASSRAAAPAASLPRALPASWPSGAGGEAPGSAPERRGPGRHARGRAGQRADAPAAAGGPAPRKAHGPRCAALHHPPRERRGAPGAQQRAGDPARAADRAGATGVEAARRARPLRP